MKIYIGTDHAGFELKERLKPFLESLGHEVKDKGAFTFDKDDDYPDFIHPVAEAVAQNPNDSKGIILGASGQGEAMAANRHNGVRAALFYGPQISRGVVDISGRTSDDPFEIVRLSRIHNNANVLSIGFRFCSDEDAKTAIKIWLETPFDGGRHERRIKRIDL